MGRKGRKGTIEEDATATGEPEAGPPGRPEAGPVGGPETGLPGGPEARPQIQRSRARWAEGGQLECILQAELRGGVKEKEVSRCLLGF